ncbi:hypothetical protein [Rhodanobacter thiooxydans]|uniref:hypothetical protein n=1 Tax=Rhodanobacter thiooxydans TaxID=416169 RepID=UPI001290413D|nr:hypothetical protein [Rhodanobacter thiooxydans]
MNPSCTPFCSYLSDRWRTSLFRADIFPGFPFVPLNWQALAFNRDNAGDMRLPSNIWRCLLDQAHERTRDTRAFVVSPAPIIGGVVMEREQPFVVPLDERSVLAHFSDMSLYLPEFFMSTASERWAIWGDSDLTVLGAECELITAVIEEYGGEAKAIEEMARDFGLRNTTEDHSMWTYLKGLVAQPESRQLGAIKGGGG